MNPNVINNNLDVEEDEMTKLYRKACVEVVVLLKYLGDSKGIPFNKAKLQKIIKDRDPEYIFNIDETIPIMENRFLGKTFELLEDLIAPEE